MPAAVQVEPRIALVFVGSVYLGLSRFLWQLVRKLVPELGPLMTAATRKASDHRIFRSF